MAGFVDLLALLYAGYRGGPAAEVPPAVNLPPCPYRPFRVGGEGEARSAVARSVAPAARPATAEERAARVTQDEGVAARASGRGTPARRPQPTAGGRPRAVPGGGSPRRRPGANPAPPARPPTQAAPPARPQDADADADADRPARPAADDVLRPRGDECH